MLVHPVILAGGSGTRLWPLSREHLPKQFLPLLGERTLFQESLRRLDGMDGVADPVVVTNEAHKALVAEQLAGEGRRASTVILEPAVRNTAPALTLAALALIESSTGINEDPVLIAMPSDHLIRDSRVFQALVRAGAALAERGNLITFGVVPTAAETEYGYIRKDKELVAPLPKKPAVGSAFQASELEVKAFWTAAFVEKPDATTAAAYVRSGEYLWNSGIFMMRASVWLEQLARYRPDIEQACQEAYARGRREGQDFLPDADRFRACPSQSIDYAVMEKAAAEPHETEHAPSPVDGPPSDTAAGCLVLPMDAGWSDLGSWSVLWEKSDRDQEGNVIRGDIFTREVRGSLLIANERLLAVVGLDDVVVVETADAILVASKDRVQDAKEIVARLKEQQRGER